MIQALNSQPQTGQGQAATVPSSQININSLLSKKNISGINRYTTPRGANELLPQGSQSAKLIDEINNFCKQIKNEEISIIEFADSFFKCFLHSIHENKSPEAIEAVFHSLIEKIFDRKTTEAFNSFSTHGKEHLHTLYEHDNGGTFSSIPLLINVLLYQARLSDAIQTSWGYPSESEKELCDAWASTLSRDLHSFSASDVTFKKALFISLMLSLHHPESIAPLLLSEVSLSEEDYSDLILRKRPFTGFEDRLTFAHTALQLATNTPRLSMIQNLRPRDFEELLSHIIFVNEEEDPKEATSIKTFLIDLAKYSRTLSIETLEELLTVEFPYTSKNYEISSFRDQIVSENFNTLRRETILKIALSSSPPERKAGLLLTYDRAFKESPALCFPEYTSVSETLLEAIRTERSETSRFKIVETALSLVLYDPYYADLFNEVVTFSLNLIPPVIIQSSIQVTDEISERFTDPSIRGVLNFLISRLPTRYRKEENFKLYDSPLTSVSELSPHILSSNIFAFLKQAVISGTNFDREDVSKGFLSLIRQFKKTSYDFEINTLKVLCECMPSLGDLGIWAINQFNEFSLPDTDSKKIFETLHAVLPEAIHIENSNMLDIALINLALQNPDFIYETPDITSHASNLLDMLSRLFTANPLSRSVSSKQLFEGIKALMPFLPLSLHPQAERLIKRFEESSHSKKAWVEAAINECCDRILNDPTSKIEFWTTRIKTLITKFAIKEFESEIPAMILRGCSFAINSYCQATTPPSTFEQRAFQLILAFKDADGFWDDPESIQLILTLENKVFPISKSGNGKTMTKWNLLLERKAADH